MKIAIMGTSRSGKSAYVQQFLQQWPMYSVPTRTFRNIVVENSLPINRRGNLDAQTLIRNSLVDQAIDMAGKQFELHDRCILDNLAYTLWLADQPDTTITPQFLKESMYLARQTVKMYDIIFYFPLNLTVTDTISTEKLTVESARTERDDDEGFRTSIDNILQTFVEYSIKRNGTLFDPTDCPPIIPLAGLPQEKIIQTSLYVDEQGNPYDTGVLLKDDINQTSSIIVP